jgi:hypothetical protein
VVTKWQREGVGNHARRCRLPQVRNSMIERYHNCVLVTSAYAFPHVSGRRAYVEDRKSILRMYQFLEHLQKSAMPPKPPVEVD